MNFLEFKLALQEAVDKMTALDIDVDECDVYVYSSKGRPIRVELQRIIQNRVVVEVVVPQ